MKNEIQLEKTPQQIEDIERQTRMFTCPCCKAELQFRTRIHITSVGLADTREEVAERDGVEVVISAPEKRRLERVDNNQELLDAAKAMGVLDAFNKAVDAHGKSLPTNRESYFVKWMENADRQNVPQFALRQCLPEKDRSGDLELWGWQNVSVVLSDGEFKCFLPRAFVNGKSISALAINGSGLGVGVKKTLDLAYWVRTRFGYVEKSGEFANEMRKHSIGGFSL